MAPSNNRRPTHIAPTPNVLHKNASRKLFTNDSEEQVDASQIQFAPDMNNYQQMAQHTRPAMRFNGDIKPPMRPQQRQIPLPSVNQVTNNIVGNQHMSNNYSNNITQMVCEQENEYPGVVNNQLYRRALQQSIQTSLDPPRHQCSWCSLKFFTESHMQTHYEDAHRPTEDEIVTFFH
jgi:hypothetical protein